MRRRNVCGPITFDCGRNRAHAEERWSTLPEQPFDELAGLLAGPVGFARHASTLSPLTVVDDGGGEALGARLKRERQLVAGVAIELQRRVLGQVGPGQVEVVVAIDADGQ